MVTILSVDHVTLICLLLLVLTEWYLGSGTKICILQMGNSSLVEQDKHMLLHKQ
jgi:hypothetical protein